MAKSSQAFPLVATICLLSLVTIAHCDDYLYIEGKVYCDTCRCSFETSLTKPMDAARVKLQCRDREGGSLTYSQEATTDATGAYKIPVAGNREEEVCEVLLLKSSKDDCNETLKGRDRARVLITSNNGITTKSRFANALGYLQNHTLPDCPKVLKGMGLLPTAIIPLPN